MNTTNSGKAPAPMATSAPSTPTAGEAPPAPSAKRLPAEIGGPKGPEPTRYGDWERGGRCIDF